MTIVVTGSAGHLGEALMRTQRARGEPALGLDIKPSSFTDAIGSITDRAFVRRCLKGARSIIHAATLHKPHLATHSKEDFIATNVTGTLVLLEEALAAKVDSFIFTSTTSAFGSALTPAPREPAAWVTEDVSPIPKNIYGVTKLAAENLCELFHRSHGLPVVVLRTSRFFPEPDDNAAIRNVYETSNVQANEMLYRRVDIEDVVSAHLLAIARAKAIGFRTYIISSTTPLAREIMGLLRRDAPRGVRNLFPDFEAIYARRGWKMFPEIDRVYVNARAINELGWKPKYDFAHVLACLRKQKDFRSELAVLVGSKGYHVEVFADGPYPVAVPTDA
jgi:UDP-glucose 4-epimerase